MAAFWPTVACLDMQRPTLMPVVAGITTPLAPNSTSLPGTRAAPTSTGTTMPGPVMTMKGLPIAASLPATPKPFDPAVAGRTSHTFELGSPADGTGLVTSFRPSGVQVLAPSSLTNRHPVTAADDLAVISCPAS